MPNKTGLDLGRKISIKVLPPLMLKIPSTPPLRGCSNLTRSYTSISHVLFKTIVKFSFT